MNYPNIDVDDELTRKTMLHAIEMIKIIDKIEDDNRDKYISFINVFMGIFTELEFIEKYKLKN